MTAVERSESARRDSKETAIIAAARSAFLARGFEAASMDAIALSAGVSKRTIYNRFRSKEELFAAAIMETCRRILPVDLEAIEATLPPAEFLREAARRLLRAVLDPESVALRRIAAFEAPRNPAIGRSYLDHGPRFMAAAGARILERLAARGFLHIDDPERAIWQLGALLMEPLNTEALMGEAPSDLDAAIEAQVEAGLSAFFKIYRP